MSEEAGIREQEMDAVCERLTWVYANSPWKNKKGDTPDQLGPIKSIVYDADDSGRIEWIHIIYRHKPDVDHVEITGMSRQAAEEAVAQRIYTKYR